MGKTNISSGEVSSGLIVNSGGSLYVLNGGTAYDTTINYGGKFIVSSGGSASGALAKPGGYIGITSDGVMSGIKENGGVVKWDSGASVFFSPNTFSDYKYGSSGNALSATLHSGTTATNITLLYAGELYVYEGGIAMGTLVKSGGDLYIYSSGQANDTVIERGGAVSVGKEGSASNVVVSQGASLYTAYDGVTYAIKEEGGVIKWADGAEVTFVPSVISGYKYGSNCSGFSATLHSGTTATNTTLNYAGEMHAYDGAEVYDTLVKSGGDLFLYAGASASGAVIENGGAVSVGKEGTISNVVVSQGAYLYTAYDGVTHAIKEEGGIVKWADGAEVTFVPSVISGYKYGSGCNGYSATLHSGTTATNTVLNYAGDVRVYNGAQVLTTRINSGGDMFVYSGAQAIGNDLKLGGAMSVFNGGYASDIVVSSGAYLVISSGGTAVSIVENGGHVEWYDGATVNILPNVFSKFTYGSGANAGSCYIHSGTTAVSTTLNYAGKFYVRNNALAIETRINSGGTMYINTLGKASATTLKKGGGIVNSGTIVDVNVSSGAIVYVSSGGKLTGKVMIENGATVSAIKGSIVNFDLTATAAGEASLLSNLSLVKGTPVFTLTVNGTQETGTYYLADGAADFNKTISVVNTSGTELGTLTLGEKATLEGVDYTLNLSDSTLLVDIVASVTPTPEPGDEIAFFPGDFNGDGFDTLAAQSGSTVTIYMNGEAWGLGLSLDPGWEIAGTGDFNADGMDDFLRVNTEGYVVGEMSNGNGTFTPQVLNLKSAGWSILGTGDFNHNGTDDVLIANPTGASETVGLLGYWESGVTWTLINGYSAEWEMVATGDYNNDGKCDMLWRNSFVGDGGLTYNAYCTWIVDPPAGQSDWRMVSVANPTEWNFLCSGDFNGDGANDIAMINDVGVVGIWGVEDGWLSSWSILSAVTDEWQLAGVGDFNADGTDDIAWRNTGTGLTGYWQINDKTLTGWQNIATISA